MRRLTFAIGVTLLASSADAAVTYGFSGTVTAETWNLQDTTGQSLGLVRAGDTVVGRFDFGPGATRSPLPNGLIVADPVTRSTLSIFRDGDLVATLTQRPAFLPTGNRVRESYLAVSNGDPRNQRDTLALTVGGVAGVDSSNPGLIVTAIALTPANPAIVVPSWSINFREQCASGSVTAGTCVSDDPSLDFYSGTETSFDLVKAFRNNSFADLGVNFLYRGPGDPLDGGDFESAVVRLDHFALVPEPASWATMLCGFVLLGSAVRRRRSFNELGRRAVRA